MNIERLKQQFRELNQGKEPSPEQLLIAGILESAVLEKDLEYLYSDTFEKHCAIIKINDDIMRVALIKLIHEKTIEGEL